MKKLIALLLAAMMVIGLCACGSNAAPAETAPEGEIKLAMISDYSDITDQSYNQTTYEACKAFAEENGLDFTYFKPASDSDNDRISVIEMAIDAGYNVIVMAGYPFGNALRTLAGDYEDITFIAMDISADNLGDMANNMPANLYSAVYKEELCGYMAGYAAVKLGYTKLGYLGGMAVPGVRRYGYGFVQGCDAAAAEMGIEGVEVNYAYGNQFYGDADITAAMDTWYRGGTQVVFACGGSIYTSVAEAAAKVGAKIIGVDVDQMPIIDGLYGEGMTVTSAMKGLATTVKTQLTAVLAGNFEGGKLETLGIISDVPTENYVQIAESTQFADGFTADDYLALVASMHAGTLTVSDDITVEPADNASFITVNDMDTLK